MKIKYWSGFSKRKNSTKQPTSGTEIDVYLKDDTSILTPTFDCVGIPATVNYIYCDDFGRYYYVDDITRAGKDRLLIRCIADPMATGKTTIGSSQFFIERSSSVDLMLPDSNVVATDEIVHTDVTSGDVIPGTNLGTYAVRILGAGGIKTYEMALNQIQSIFNSYYSTAFTWNNVEDCLQNLFTAVADPAKYVRSVKMFCVDIASSTSDYPSFGFLTGTVSCPICKESLHKTVAITKPARYYNDWRDYDSRFTTASIRFPGVGDVNLDPMYLSQTLSCWYDIDINIGSCRVTLMAGSKIIGIFDGVAGVDVPIGGMSGVGGLAAVPGLITSMSLDVGSFVGDAASSTKNIIEGALKPPTNILSAAGCIAEWLQYPFIIVTVSHRGSTIVNPIGLGRPDMHNRQISSLSGYIKCANASIDIGLTDREKDTINGFLNSGFYYE